MRFSPGPLFGATPPGLRADDPLIAGKYAKLERMLAYARSTAGCRRRTLLDYLGQHVAPSVTGCGGCDACGVTVESRGRMNAWPTSPTHLSSSTPSGSRLELIEANVACARDEGRDPLGRQTLRDILPGNAYALLRHVREPYLRDWKDRRLRSFRQWGLLASFPGRGEAIEQLFDRLIGHGWATNQRVGGADAPMTYTYLGLTDTGLQHVLSSAAADADRSGPMTPTEARRCIEKLARRYRDRRKRDPELYQSYTDMLKMLSEEIYSQDSHFVYELIQNAEDNAYPEGCTDRFVHFTLDGRDIIVRNNEVGFSPANVEAICAVAHSTKVDRTRGYVGEKGIGFKSVFKVTARPQVYSGSFRFQFDDDSFVVPSWCEPAAGVAIDAATTTIVLPLRPASAMTSGIPSGPTSANCPGRRCCSSRP